MCDKRVKDAPVLCAFFHTSSDAEGKGKIGLGDAVGHEPATFLGMMLHDAH
jgi:hypothetical protein